MTYGEADAAAREIAAGLCSLDVVPGDRVCILSQTRVEWALCDLGIAMAAAVSVPIYASLTAAQCAFIVADSKARLTFAEDAVQMQKLLPLAGASPPHKLVHIDEDAQVLPGKDEPDAEAEPAGARRRRLTVEVVMNQAGPAAPQIKSLAALREAGRAYLADPRNSDELDRRARMVNPATLFTIVYTSGTTGDPKGAVIPHACLTAALGSGCRALSLQATDVQYLFLPLAHVLAREMLWAPFYEGATTAFSQGTAKIKEDLTEVRPTFMAGVPRVFEKFHTGVKARLNEGGAWKRAMARWAVNVGQRHAAGLREGKGAAGGFTFRTADALVLGKLRARLGLDRCRFLISGGAPLAAEVATFFHGVGLLILEGYGLTETMSAAFVNRLDRHRFGTVGPALDVVECRIASDGEILLRGPSMFKEYFNNPAATREAKDDEGWFATGDIGHLEDGFLRITDRKKDLIVLAGGKKVAPQPIENAIKAQATLISQVVVVGDRQSYCVALVTLNEDEVRARGLKDAAGDAAVRKEIDAAVAAVNTRLAPFESVRSFAILPRDFTEASGELTPSLKVKRKVVLQNHAAAIERLYRA
jgi:long-chain acyl-CoA synthetase